MMIWVKQVNFKIEQISEVYGLPNDDIKQFHAKPYETGSRIANILSLGKEVPLSTTKRDILMNDLTTEAMLWLNIIYSRLSPCTHITIIKDI